MTATTTSSAASATSVKIIVRATRGLTSPSEPFRSQRVGAHRTSANGRQSPRGLAEPPRGDDLASNRSLTSPIFRNLYAGLGGRRATA